MIAILNAVMLTADAVEHLWLTAAVQSFGVLGAVLAVWAVRDDRPLGQQTVLGFLLVAVVFTIAVVVKVWVGSGYHDFVATP